MVEAVVRGYLAGSGWKEYQHNAVGLRRQAAPGLKNASKLPEPIFTPATKADVGDHDENISFEQWWRWSARTGRAMRDLSIRSTRRPPISP
jgi:phosphoribosylaminoimidazole-succinocarboxamide synthase